MVIKTPVCIFKFEKSPIGKVPKLEWYPYVLLFPDLLCKTVKVSPGENTFQRLDTLHQISTKKSVLLFLVYVYTLFYPSFFNTQFNPNSPKIQLQSPLKHSSPVTSLLHSPSPSTGAGKKPSPFDVHFIV